MQLQKATLSALPSVLENGYVASLASLECCPFPCSAECPCRIGGRLFEKFTTRSTSRRALVSSVPSQCCFHPALVEICLKSSKYPGRFAEVLSSGEQRDSSITHLAKGPLISQLAVRQLRRMSM
jgi:hypothetical protein